jgi:hypothetical protein
MIEHIEFSKAQRKIIREICETQIASLKRLHDQDSGVDVELILAQYGADKEDYKEQLSSVITKFQEVFNNPERITLLDDSQISIFRHILNTLEDNFLEWYPNAVKNLWKKLFDIEDFKLNHTSPHQLN